MSKTDIVPWWLILLQGLAALIIGIYLILYPVRTTIYLVQILGWYWLFAGLLTLGIRINIRSCRLSGEG